MKRYGAALAASSLLLAIGTFANAGTPNTTAAGAVSYEVGAGWVTDGVDDSSQNRWFIFTEFAGRSYCVEAGLGPATYLAFDPNLTLYSDSAGTVIYLSNTDGAGDPPQYRGARVCYQSALAVGTTTARLFKVNVPNTAGDSGFIRTRVVDTTVVLPGMNLRNDGAGNPSNTIHLIVSNTTTVDVNATFYVPGYGALKTFSGNSRFLAPSQTNNNSGYARWTIQGPAGVAGWKWAGTCYLTNDGPPGALEVWADSVDLDPAPSGTVRQYGYQR